MRRCGWMAIFSLFVFALGLGVVTADEPSDEDLSKFIKKGPRKPARVGERVKIPFPPPQGSQPRPGVKPDVRARPLKVVRYQPEGKEQFAHTISVTFNQPMVSVSSLAEIKKENIPIGLEPNIPGTYRWAGTRTITFEPEGRIPFATRFKVTVPAGVASARGTRLKEPFVFFFDTPVPTVGLQPSNGSSELELNPMILLNFNLAVSGSKVARFVSLKSEKGKKIPLRLVPRETWKGDSRISYWARPDQNPNRRVIFVLKRPLVRNTTYLLEVSAGLVSDEGPLVMPKSVVSKFSTYSPLKVVGLTCQADYYDYDYRKECIPGGELVVRFNHGLKIKSPKKYISVSPRPKGLKIRVQGAWVYLAGKFKAGKSYRVKVRGGVKDQYSQVLKKGWAGKMPFVHMRPQLNLGVSGVSVIEPGESLRLPVSLLNVKWFTVMVYRIPDQKIWRAMSLTGRSHYEPDFKRDLVEIKKLQVSSFKEKPRFVWDQWKIHGVSLKKVVRRHGPGAYLVVLHTPILRNDSSRYQSVLVQVSDLALTAKYDNRQIVVLATSLKTGKKVSKVRLNLVDDDNKNAGSATTGKDGLAVIEAPVPPREKNRSRMLLQASLGKDRSFLEIRGSGDDNRYVSMNWGRDTRSQQVRTFLHADRDLYRPGEDVYVFGISRQYDNSQEQLPGSLPEDYNKISWNVRSARGLDLAKGITAVTKFGRFHFKFKLPDDVDLGWTRISIKFENIRRNLGGHTSFSIQTQEYRAPEFKVGVDIHSRPLFFKDDLTATIHGDYLFGAPMRNANVSWSLYSSQARFSAPNHAGFHFGDMRPRWHWYHRRYHGPYRSHIAGSSGKLDEHGQLKVKYKLPDWSQSDPSSLILESQVTDENRQVVSGRSSVLAHPADQYVGIRLSSSLVEAGEPFKIGLVVVDLDGKRIPKLPIKVKLVGEISKRVAGKDTKGLAITRWETKIEEAASCEMISSDHVVECEFNLAQGGSYTIVASSIDSKERPIKSTTWLDVFGEGYVSKKQTDAQKVELMPSKQEYQPGDTAKIVIRAPFASGLVLFTQDRNGLIDYQLLKLEKNMAIVKVPILEKHIPNLEISATAIAARPRGKKGKRPKAAWANGSIRLKISTDRKKLNVVARPASCTARPGQKVPVDIQVTDYQGRPIQAQLGIVAVDEAVLSMTGFKTPDPLPTFYFFRAPGVALAETLKRLMPEMKKLTPEMQKDMQAPGMMKSRAAKRGKSMEAEEVAMPAVADDVGEDDQAGEVAVRKFFLTTPLAQLVTSDAQGKARLKLQLPDNLTTFRLMVVAVDLQDRFGSSEARVTSQKPLLARPALPRFANYGDAFDAAVIINNETGKSKMAKVELKTKGITRLDPVSKLVFAPSGKATEVAFRVRADRPGRAVFTFTVRLDDEADAVQTVIPVWVPATTEAFATYGTTTSSVAQPVRPPKDALRNFGGLELTLSATALTGLQDAVRYLVEYPYECVEQTSSRLLPILALGKILEEFKIGGLESQKLRESLARRAIKKLVSSQRSDGGWGYWWGSSDSVAHLTSYVLLVLRKAKETGFEVPDDTLKRAKRHLVNWMQRSRSLPDDKKRTWWRRYVLDTYAMALYVLTNQKDKYPTDAKLVYDHREELDLFAWAMLTAVYHRQNPKSTERKALLRELSNRVVETPSGIHFAEARSESLRMLMHSSSRTDSIALLVYLEVDPENDMIPKIVRALVDARIKGRWETTQANAYALLALSRYYQIFESEPTEFSALMWLGDGFLGQTNFEKKTMREADLKVPMKYLFETGPADLILKKDGAGRLYYRIGLSYAPRNLDLKSLEQGFTVSRTYEPIENKADVSGDNQKGWLIKAGAYVRVHLMLVVPDRRYYVVVDDPLPAGLEIVNLAYKTSARNRLDQGDAGGWYRYWISWMFNHRELRDERALHFADQLSAGVYHVTYITRATAKGDFIAPPAKAEEMYRPEVFGRSSTDRLTVE
ncbi:MAG: Ig-like domain-containing protein [Deltaproteobacteria bacterium]|nr:Ig-like domain-containing protein [Deltaproteobacteria bacterium]